MSDIGVIVISILGGIFLAVIMASAGYLIWQGHSLRKTLTAAQDAFKDVSHQVTLLTGDIRTTLETHRREMGAQVDRINGEKLAEASAAGIIAARRIEAAAVAIGELVSALLSEDAVEKARDSGLKPEDYAPETGERHVSLSRTGAADRADLSDEGEQD